jgi:predicted nucleic acid-binding protein
VALILDTSVLYADLDRRDDDHAACHALIEAADEPRIIPVPVLAELDYLVSDRMHPGIFLALLDDVLAGAYQVMELVGEDYVRIRDLCDRYADSQIGFVDAAVMAVVERLGEQKLATLDHRHFGMIRPRHVDALRLVPEAR